MKNIHASEHIVTVVIVCGIVVIAIAGLIMAQFIGNNAESVTSIVTVGIAALGLQPRTLTPANPVPTPNPTPPGVAPPAA